MGIVEKVFDRWCIWRLIMNTDYYEINKKYLERFKDKLLLPVDGKLRHITIDGPVSPNYNNADKRILWVLREPHGDGGWSLIDYILDDIVHCEKPWEKYSKWHVTYSLIIKASYGILFDNMSTNSFKYHPLKHKESLKFITVINLNKFGGGGKKSSHYHNGVNVCKDLIKWQMTKLQPDIVILAGTGQDCNNPKYNFIPSHMSIPELWAPSKDYFPWVKADNGAIYISAYHAGQRTIKHNFYFKNLIQAITG